MMPPSHCMAPLELQRPALRSRLGRLADRAPHPDAAATAVLRCEMPPAAAVRHVRLVLLRRLAASGRLGRLPSRRREEEEEGPSGQRRLRFGGSAGRPGAAATGPEHEDAATARGLGKPPSANRMQSQEAMAGATSHDGASAQADGRESSVDEGGGGGRDDGSGGNGASGGGGESKDGLGGDAEAGPPWRGWRLWAGSVLMQNLVLLAHVGLAMLSPQRRDRMRSRYDNLWEGEEREDRQRRKRRGRQQQQRRRRRAAADEADQEEQWRARRRYWRAYREMLRQRERAQRAHEWQQAEHAAADGATGSEGQRGKPEGPEVTYRQYVARWARIMNCDNEQLTFLDIPWPPLCNPLFLESGDSTDVKRVKLRRALLMWHPDKFAARFAGRLDQGERERISCEVMRVAQERKAVTVAVALLAATGRLCTPGVTPSREQILALHSTLKRLELPQESGSDWLMQDIAIALLRWAALAQMATTRRMDSFPTAAPRLRQKRSAIDCAVGSLGAAAAGAVAIGAGAGQPPHVQLAACESRGEPPAQLPAPVVGAGGAARERAAARPAGCQPYRRRWRPDDWRWRQGALEEVRSVAAIRQPWRLCRQPRVYVLAVAVPDVLHSIAALREDGQRTSAAAAATAAVDWSFALRLLRLARLARARGALLLVALALAHVLVTAQVGQLAGLFYKALVDGNASLFWRAVKCNVLWYGLATLGSAAQQWAAEWLSLGWRRNLTQAAHESYCRNANVYRVGLHFQELDNPDQRIAQEISSFCRGLADFLAKTVAAPFMVLYYGWWTWSRMGWYAPAAGALFFLMAAALTRRIISPIAALVAKQDRLEADFRMSHFRLKKYAEEVALHGSGPTEAHYLDADLTKVLTNQRLLADRHFLLKLATGACDYCGSLSSYLVLALMIFGGQVDRTMDKGAMAQLISNSAFAILQLIYSFSQVIDASKVLSEVAGAASRVAELLEVFDTMSSDLKEPSSADQTLDIASFPAKSDGSIGSYALAMMENSELASNGLLIGPVSVTLPSGDDLEFSIHRAPVELLSLLAAVFPGVSPNDMLIVPTFQCSALDLCAGNADDQDEVAEEMDRMLAAFLSFQISVCEFLRGRGHWADAVDPKSGHALAPSPERPVRSPQSSIEDGQAAVLESRLPYSEAYAASVLLAYATVEAGACIVTRHPVLGTRCYPASLFTTAPLQDLLLAIDQVAPHSIRTERARVTGSYSIGGGGCHEERIGSHSILYMCDSGSASADLAHEDCRPDTEPISREARCNVEASSQPILLGIHHLTLCAPRSELLLIKDLSVTVAAGRSLLVIGDSGAGKSSLVRAIGRLWPLAAGAVKSTPGLRTLYVTQRPLLCRGGLAAQILYPREPDSMSSNEGTALWLEPFLEMVGLQDLLRLTGGDWKVPLDWSRELSPGEQQSLVLARVLCHRPQLAILDEATTAISKQAEAQFYGHLVASGTCFVSLSHGSSLEKWHHSVLTLLGDGRGGWRLRPSTNAPSDSSRAT
eukprot:SM000100S09395  [mRNA]  locus=s100:158570:166525:+ [translate_table: standard]